MTCLEIDSPRKQTLVRLNHHGIRPRGDIHSPWYHTWGSHVLTDIFTPLGLISQGVQFSNLTFQDVTWRNLTKIKNSLTHWLVAQVGLIYEKN